MANCPNRDVSYCLYGLSEMCRSCPAYTWRVRFALFMRRWLWSLGVVAALMAFALTPATVRADHNTAHDCPSAVANAVLSGAKGGTFYQRPDAAVVWTDGAYVCVFQGGRATTFFKSRNALKYVAKDVAKHSAKQIAQSAAQKVVSAAKGTVGRAAEGLLAAVPDVLLNPTCVVYNAKGKMTNVCLDPNRRQ
jgi:hypothetical protein